MISKNTFTLLLFFVLLLPFVGNSQVDDVNQCIEKGYPFTGEPENTLCDDYGNIVCDLEIGEGTSYTHSSQLGTSVTGNVCIIGDFIVDQTFQFFNATVKVNTDVSIQMNVTGNLAGSGGWLFITNSKLFACQGLWKGITLNNESAIYTYNNVQFEDAETAIHAKDRSVLIIRQTTFNRNVDGIHLERTSTNKGDVPYLIDLQQNDFICNAPLNGTLDEVSFSGIKMTATHLFSLSLPENRFEGLQYGIYAQGNAHVGANHFSFRKMKRDGIFMEFGSLEVENSFFTNCEENGINIELARLLNIRENIFSLNFEIPDLPIFMHRTGIHINGFGLNAYANIESDFVTGIAETENVFRGINIEGGNVGAGSTITIRNSDFNIRAQNSAGIYFEGPFPESFYPSIYANDFATGHPDGVVGSGIHLQGTINNAKIFANYFTGNGYWNRGIFGSGSVGINNKFSNNLFEGSFYIQTSGEYHAFGMQFFNFQNTLFCSNVNNFGSNNAFQFYGNNIGTELINNEIYATGAGVYLAATPTIGPQKHFGNKWFPVTSELGIFTITWRASEHAICSNCEESQVENSKFTLHTPQSIYEGGGQYLFFSEYHPENITPDEMDEFFEIEEDGELASECSFFNAEGLITNELDQKIADGITSLEGNPSNNYSFKRHLYQKLKNNPNSIDEYATYNSFLNQQKNTTIGQFDEVSRKIEAAIAIDEEVQEYLNNLKEQTQSIYNSLAKVDSLLALDENDSDLDILTNTKIDFLNQLELIDLNYDSVNNIYKEQIHQGLTLAYQQNEAIATTEIFESNEQTVNRIYLLLLLNPEYELTEIQLEQLEAIAQQAPNQGGFSVFKALNLLPNCRKATLELIRPEIVDAGNPIKSYDVKEKKNTFESPITTNSIIYPNPSHSSFFIQKIIQKDGKVLITNLTGQIVLEQSISKGESNIEIKHQLSQGVYLVSLLVEGESSIVERLVIQNN